MRSGAWREVIYQWREEENFWPRYEGRQDQRGAWKEAELGSEGRRSGETKGGIGGKGNKEILHFGLRKEEMVMDTYKSHVSLLMARETISQ